MKALRGPWLLAAGLVLGLALGFFYARVISPLAYSDTAPLSLKPEAKDSYRLLVAAAFSADGDLGRARARLSLLQELDPARALAAQAQQLVARGGSSNDARQLALLAVSLGKDPGTANTPLPAATSIPTSSAVETAAPTLALAARATDAPTATARPLPTLTPTLTPTTPPNPAYVLKKSTPVCDPALGQPLIQVEVRDRDGFGVPGVEARVTWTGGQDAFYTGLHPQQGPGYADFTMTPGVVYSLSLQGTNQPVDRLSAAACPAPTGSDATATTFPGSILLEFAPP